MCDCQRPVKFRTVSLMYPIDEDHFRHHRAANSALLKLDHVDDMSHGVVDEPQRSSNMILILRGRRLFEVCLATCVEFARCSRSDPTGKHLQRCNTQARFSLCWKASRYLQQDLSVSGSELRTSLQIPTSRTWVPHGDGDINMLALLASLTLSQNGILNALCLIFTITRSHTEVRWLRLDHTGDARFCAGTAPLLAAREVEPQLLQSC